MTVATIVAVAAAVLAFAALAATVQVLRRVRSHADALDREIERGKAAFDEVVAREAAARAEELSRTLARERADSMSQLADEERRIAEERRRDVAERERDATAKLAEALTAAQRRVEQKLADWTLDLEKLQQGMADELARIAQRQRQVMAEIEARIGQDAEGFQTTIDEQRAVVLRLRTELEQASQAVVAAAASDLDQHAAERRRALQEVAERLRRRERDLQEQIEREQTDASQRITVSLGDIERRQIEQLQRVVSRAATRYSEAAAQQFETSIRSAREEAARRLGRELDLAVERFSREAEGVLAERVDHVSDAAVKRVEARLSQLRTALDRLRDESIGAVERRAQDVEAGLRDRLEEIAADAESERTVLETRLHELQRRLDELAARA